MTGKEQGARVKAFEQLLHQAATLGDDARVSAGCALWRQGGTRIPDDLDIALNPAGAGIVEALGALRRAFPDHRWTRKAHGEGSEGWSGTGVPGEPTIDANIDAVWIYAEPAVTDPTGAKLAALTDIAALKLWLLAKRDLAKDTEDLHTIETLDADCAHAAEIAVAKVGAKKGWEIARRCDERGLTTWAEHIRACMRGASTTDPHEG